VVEVQLNQAVIQQSMANLQHHSAIAYFVGRKQNPEILKS
jgi:hypothetical protein